MSSIQILLDEYGESHRNQINKTIHWICVPAIVWSLLGLIWAIPFPLSINIGSFPLNWATLLIGASVIYYFRLSVTLAVGMLLVTGLLLFTGYWVSGYSSWPLWKISLTVFTVAWVGQFIGHKIEGKKPSFLKDVQFLLIGPVWLLSFIYRRLGIPY